jgi:hypothetical protein
MNSILRMRRRRLALAATLLATLAVTGAAAIAETRHLSDSSGIVFTRHDGTTFSFPNAFVRCGPSNDGGGRLAIKVGSVPPPGDPIHSHFEIEAILADVTAHRTVRFPDDYVFGSPKGASIFVFDHDDPHSVDGNEASSSEEDAKGKIVFHKARCKPKPRVWLTVHAMLGSEFFGVHRVGIDGSFRGRG